MPFAESTCMLDWEAAGSLAAHVLTRRAGYKARRYNVLKVEGRCRGTGAEGPPRRCLLSRTLWDGTHRLCAQPAGKKESTCKSRAARAQEDERNKPRGEEKIRPESPAARSVRVAGSPLDHAEDGTHLHRHALARTHRVRKANRRRCSLSRLARERMTQRTWRFPSAFNRQQRPRRLSRRQSSTKGGTSRTTAVSVCVQKKKKLPGGTRGGLAARIMTLGSRDAAQLRAGRPHFLGTERARPSDRETERVKERRRGEQ